MKNLILLLKSFRLLNVFSMLLLLVGLKVFNYHSFVQGGNYVFLRSTTAFIFFLMTVGLISIAGYLVNDIVDVEVDKINRPNKRLAFSKNILWGIYIFLNVLAIAFSIFIANSAVTFLILMAAIVLLFLYSMILQKLPLVGNLVVALLAGVLPLLYDKFDLVLCVEKGIDLLSGFKYSLTIPIYGGLGFIVTFSREIVKDMEDVVGDRQAGYRTLAVIFGVDNVKRYLLVFMFLSLLLWLFFIVLYIMEVSSFSFVSVFIMLAVICFFLSMLQINKDEYSKASLYLKLSLFSGVLMLFIL